MTVESEPVAIANNIPAWLRIACVVLVCILATVFFYTSSPPPISEEDTEYTYAPSSDSELDCFLGPISAECQEWNKASNSKAEENERSHANFVKDKRDLNAQEGVWRGTNAVVFLTMLATVFAGAGLYMIAKTLEATRETFKTTNEMLTQARIVTGEAFKTTDQAKWATEAANRSADAAERAERPYVTFTVDAQYVGGKKGTKEGPFNEIQVTPVLTNHGRSAAVDLSYWVYVSGQDKDTVRAAALGHLPRDTHVAIGAGEAHKMNALPPFPQGFYYEFNERHYVVSCVFTYSDVRGNLITERQMVNFQVWPQMPGESGDVFDIGVRRIESEALDVAKQTADKYAEKLRGTGIDPQT